MEYNDIIFVTAFKNINRENWGHYGLSVGRYVDYFYTLASNIQYKLIVYLEKDVKELYLERYGNIKIDNVVFEELDIVDTFLNRFLEKDKIIIESQIYKDKIPEYRENLPEHNHSDYNLINHSKINFVRHTKEKYPDYLFYAWIDFGRMNESIDNIPRNLDISLIPENKITYHYVNEPPHNKIDENDMLKDNAVYLLGSSFIVPNNLVESFEKLWENKLLEWQDKYITDDDQNLVLQLYFDNNDLFYGLKNDKWYNMYTNLIKKEE